MRAPRVTPGGYKGWVSGWLNLRQAAYFVAVVEERSFTRAARRLQVAQPSLSQQIRALEKQVGTALLERSGRGVTPTPAGEAFLAGARAALGAADGAISRARTAAGRGGAALHVATVAALVTWVLPRVVARWRPGHPGVGFRITEFPEPAALAEFVAAGGADLAVGTRPDLAWRGPVRSLGDQRFVLVVPDGDPRAGTVVELAAFAAEDWVLFPADHGLRATVLAACAAAGFRPRQAVETRQVEAAARLAAAGLGVALVPAEAVPRDLAGLCVTLADPPAREVVVYARAPFAPPADAFVELLATLDLGLVRTCT